jgi:hypothetical protein
MRATGCLAIRLPHGVDHQDDLDTKYLTDDLPAFFSSSHWKIIV